MAGSSNSPVTVVVLMDSGLISGFLGVAKTRYLKRAHPRTMGCRKKRRKTRGLDQSCFLPEGKRAWMAASTQAPIEIVRLRMASSTNESEYCAKNTSGRLTQA